MDGTMIANMKHHDLAWQEFLKRHGIEMSEEERKQKISSRRIMKFSGHFLETIPQLIKEKYMLMRRSKYIGTYIKSTLKKFLD